MEQKEFRWREYRATIGDALYNVACDKGSNQDPNDETALAIWHLSEDAYGLARNASAICNLVLELQNYLVVPGIQATIDKLISCLDNEFGICPSFWTRTPKLHETARSQRVPA